MHMILELGHKMIYEAEREGHKKPHDPVSQCCSMPKQRYYIFGNINHM